MKPRHAKPDRVGIALGAVWAAGSALVVVILASVSSDPCSCEQVPLAGRTPVSVPDHPMSDSL